MFYACREEYKHNECFLKTKQTLTMYKINLHKISKCLWPEYIDTFVVKLIFFFEIFTNHLPKIHRSVLHKISIDLLYFRNISDVNLWKKLAITVKLSFIETRLKQGYEQDFLFLKITRETINISTIAVIHYFS